MAPPVLDSVVDDQGQPVHRGTARPVKKDMLVGSSTLSSAETVPLQEVVQQATQTYHAVPSLNAIAAQARAQLQRLKESMASRIWQTTAAQVQTALLTEYTRVQELVASKAGETSRYQKMLSSITEENTQFQQFQKALSMPPLWNEENRHLLQMAASFRTMEQEAQTLLNSAPPAWLAAMQTATAHAREAQSALRADSKRGSSEAFPATPYQG